MSLAHYGIASYASSSDSAHAATPTKSKSKNFSIGVTHGLRMKEVKRFRQLINATQRAVQVPPLTRMLASDILVLTKTTKPQNFTSGGKKEWCTNGMPRPELQQNLRIIIKSHLNPSTYNAGCPSQSQTLTHTIQNQCYYLRPILLSYTWKGRWQVI